MAFVVVWVSSQTVWRTKRIENDNQYAAIRFASILIVEYQITPKIPGIRHRHRHRTFARAATTTTTSSAAGHVLAAELVTFGGHNLQYAATRDAF